MKSFVSKLGFSISVPDGWHWSENFEKSNLAEDEKERQKEWQNSAANENLSDKEKILKLLWDTFRGLDGNQFLHAVGRKMFYDKLLSKHGKIYQMQQNILQPVIDTLKNSPGFEEITTAGLRIYLQRMTNELRLQAKEKLYLLEGFAAIGEDNNEDNPCLKVYKFMIQNIKTPVELYQNYMQAMPIWFWSGIPDKLKTIKNDFVDMGEIVIVESYRMLTEPDIIYASAIVGTTGWIITGFSTARFPKYITIFLQMVNSLVFKDE